MTELTRVSPMTFSGRVQAPSFQDGIDRFLEAFCTDGALLRSAFARHRPQLKKLLDGEVLCRLNDPADGLWIVKDGEIKVERASFPLFRKAGELVGEAAYYRKGSRIRGATLSASGDTTLFHVEEAFVRGLSDHERSVWHETMARVLASKLDEATDARDILRENGLGLDTMLRRFAGSDGSARAYAALSNGSRIEPEECEAVVWFSDIAGFSAHAAGLTPSQMGTLVAEIMEIQGRAIRDNGGEIDKQMGDGLMAFWRGPDHEGFTRSAHRAVTAAVQAADALDTLFRDRALPFDVRIGLHGGSVVIGDFGWQERIAFTLIGKTVNDASRFEQAHRSVDDESLGRIRVSQDLFRHIAESELRAAFDPQPRRFLDKNSVPFVAFNSRDNR